MMTPFSPHAGRTVNIDVSSSSQSVLVATTPNIRQVRVMNNGTATAWVRFGDSTDTASVASDIPVPAGAIEVLTITKTDGPLYALVVAAAATGKIYFTPGSGL